MPFPSWILWACLSCQFGFATFLPTHLHCGRLGRYHTRDEAGRVWRRLGADSGLRADKTCCSLDKISSVLEYTSLVLDFKVNTMEQQRAFAKQVEGGIGRSKSESPCQPLMSGRFADRLNALQQVALPFGLQGLKLARRVVQLTLRPCLCFDKVVPRVLPCGF